MKKNTASSRVLTEPRQLVLGACVVAAITVFAATAQAQTLVAKWNVNPVAANQATAHGMGYNPTTGNLIVSQCSGAASATVYSLKTTDGSANANLSTTGLPTSGHLYMIGGSTVASDGTIYACSLNRSTSPTGGGTQKIYSWANEGATPSTLCTWSWIGNGDQGKNLSVYGTGNNAVFLLTGTSTTAIYVYWNGSAWAQKLLTIGSQTHQSKLAFVSWTPTSCTYITKNSAGTGFRGVFDPTAASPIAVTTTTITGTGWLNGAGTIQNIAYDPVSTLIGGFTRNQNASPFTVTMNSWATGLPVAAGGTILTPAAQTPQTGDAAAYDSGAIGCSCWGNGMLFCSPGIANFGIRAFEVTTFLVKAPANTVATVGDATATMTGVFGGSSITYAWKKGTTPLSDDLKYSGTGTATLTIHNLVGTDTDDYTVTATGVSSSTASGTGRLTVNNGPAGPKTWNGGSLVSDNWSDAANWGGSGLNFAGDPVFFAGSTRLTPVMDSSYDVSALTFNSGASAFSISASGGSALTLSGGITNSSANDQTVNVPLTLVSTRTFNAAAGNVVLSGTISGLGGISKVGTQTLRLAGSSANTFNGLAISQGNVAFAKAPGANAVGGSITLSTGTSLTLEASDQIADNYVLDLQTANATMSLASGVTETLAGFSVGGTTTRTNSGAVVLHAGAHLTIIPSVAAGNYSAVSILGDIGGSGNVGTKFIVDSAAPPTAELRWTPTNMVNTFEKLVIQNGGRLRCGHGGNAWLPQDTMLGAVPSSFMQDQITISNGWLGLNSSFVPYPIDATNTVVVNANRGMTILSNATIETFQNVVFPGKITGTGPLIHNGGADLALLGANDYTGDTQVGVGSLTLGNSGAAGTGTIKILSNTGALAVSAHGLTIPNHIDLSTALTNNFSTLYNDTNFTISGDVDLSNSGTSPQIKVPASTATVTFSGLLTNALGLIKGGAGKVVLTRNNTYSGATEVLEGTLVVDGAPTSIAAYTIDAVGTLGGTGIISGPITLNGTVSPGSSVGTLTTVDQTWNGGGHYKWEIDDANGTAGTSPGWDKLVINGPLTITASSGAKFTIDVAGTAANFNNGVPKSWIIASASGGISGFDAAAFDVNTSGLSNPLGGAYFTVSTSGNDLLLNLVVGTVGTGTGLIGNYYNAGTGASPTSIPDPATLTREDPTINFNWGLGSPDPLINIDHFIVRWTGYVQPMYSQDYTFIATTDDGVRLWVNGQQVINNWIDKTPTDTISSPAIALVGGQKYGLVMEYYEDAVGASAILSWSTPSRGREVIPQTQLYPASLPVQPAFTLSPDHTSMTISWSGTYSLRSATDLNGPWLPVTSSSPFIATIELSQPQVFYRLVSE